ncbi:MAG: hypothetical protein WC869_15820 [Phycisphaerae bacterium]|jgi:hypothetical protein
MIQSLVVTFAGQSLPEDPYWLTIIPPVYDDRATVADVAKVVDALYGLNPCIASQGETPKVPPQEPQPEDLPRAAQAIDLDLCRVLMSGDYEAEIKVIRSHPDIPYKFIPSIGEVKQTVRVEEEVTVTVDVKAATEVTLDFPVVSGLTASWLGASGSELSARHNTLFWQGSATGTIRACFKTVYDLVTLLVPGLKDFPEDPSGDPQSSDILVFYHYQAYTATVEPPPKDAAADDSFMAAVCGWISGGGSGTGEVEKPLPEDPPLPVDPCFDPNEQLADLDFYKQQCCHFPSWPLPHCQGFIAGHKPGKGLDQSVMDEIRAWHSGPVEFVGIGNPGPEGCGEIIHRIEVNQKNCCGDILPLVADPANPSTISSNGRVKMCVTGGGPILTWQAGGGLYFDNGSSTIVTSARCLYVNAPHDFCARSAIEVSDNCTQLSMILVKPYAAPLVLCDELHQDMVLAPNGYILFQPTGGVPPSTGWQSDKLIYRGDGQTGLFQAPPDFCGSAEVTVQDSCMATASCVVRSTAGFWQDQPLPGDICGGYSTAGATIMSWNQYGAFTELISRGMKINSYVEIAYWSPHVCVTCPCGTDLGSLSAALIATGNSPDFLYAAESLVKISKWECS